MQSFLTGNKYVVGEWELVFDGADSKVSSMEQIPK